MAIIGLVGPFGSGCSTVSKIIESDCGYCRLSLSDIVKNLFSKEYPQKSPSRKELQDYGNNLREKNGGDILAKEVCSIINADKNENKDFVIDSIRNPEEIKTFRNLFPDFFLFGVFAEQDNRYSRVKSKYDDDRRQFETDDLRDSGIGESYKFGQQVTSCFRTADLIILNNDTIRKENENEKFFKIKIKEKVDLIENRISFRPTAIETYMAMAYAASMRSSCLKRKVGAIIIDETGNVFSSGYNEVPITQKTCLNEYGECYRDTLKNDFRRTISKHVSDVATQNNVYREFNKGFKILDYCRALHAEENAVINVAKAGSSGLLGKAQLYTTTYPCNLCANKIVQVGIKNIVYFEPYPMKEAKAILEQGNIIQIPFEGVTYSGYFRLMEVIEK